MMEYIYEMLAMLPAIVIAMSFHEFAHAYVAHLMGDETAEKVGRLTLNPISHVDPIGLVMIIVGGFGWAIPVPVNENNFKYKKLGIFLVSIAGVTMNLFISILTVIILSLTKDFINVKEYELIMSNIIMINIAFAAFNILPIPPLDGSKILVSFLPENARMKFYQYERYGVILLIFLVVTDKIDLLLTPAILFVSNIFYSVANFFI